MSKSLRSFNPRRFSQGTLIFLIIVAVYNSYLVSRLDPAHGIPTSAVLFGTIGWIAFDFFELKLGDVSEAKPWLRDPAFGRAFLKMVLVVGSAWIALATNFHREIPLQDAAVLVIYLLGLLVAVHSASARSRGVEELAKAGASEQRLGK